MNYDTQALYFRDRAREVKYAKLDAIRNPEATKAAIAALMVQYDLTKDAIMADPTKGADAVAALQAWTFTA